MLTLADIGTLDYLTISGYHKHHAAEKGVRLDSSSLYLHAKVVHLHLESLLRTSKFQAELALSNALLGE